MAVARDKEKCYPFGSILGLVAQLGERCVRNAEVVGSIPIRSTIQYFYKYEARPTELSCRKGAKGDRLIAAAFRNAEVVGSIPIRSTNLNISAMRRRLASFAIFAR